MSLIVGLLACVTLAAAAGQYPAALDAGAETAPAGDELFTAEMGDDLAPPTLLGAAACASLILVVTQPHLPRLSRRWPPPLRPPQP